MLQYNASIILNMKGINLNSNLWNCSILMELCEFELSGLIRVCERRGVYFDSTRSIGGTRSKQKEEKRQTLGPKSELI